MSQAYMCSDLDSIVRRGPEHARVDRENRELEDAIAARDEVVVTSARDRACYHTDMAAAEAAAKRVHWDSSLAEALDRCRRQDEESNRQRERRKECVKWTRFDDGVGPSSG
ncbi:hypothetical protein QYE76_023698 [Lolium multiflorum]|uniref:Uncharacterized protein n=1 Tax=Lolium multiflorum TaxID=4521 RepID=A0AAD8RC98_LOLMU|nr:hypothetical protein QYE76_023698 [Lolium multiflorum]